MLCDIERNLKMFQRALDLVHNVAGGDVCVFGTVVYHETY